MKGIKTLAVLVGLAVIAIASSDASAYLHPRLGRFLSRDPGPGGPMRVGAARPPAVRRFAQRDPIGQYADGMNLYQYVRSKPIDSRDPMGLEVQPNDPAYREWRFVQTLHANSRIVRTDNVSEEEGGVTDLRFTDRNAIADNFVASSAKCELLRCVPGSPKDCWRVVPKAAKISLLLTISIRKTLPKKSPFMYLNCRTGKWSSKPRQRDAEHWILSMSHKSIKAHELAHVDQVMEHIDKAMETPRFTNHPWVKTCRPKAEAMKDIARCEATLRHDMRIVAMDGYIAWQNAYDADIARNTYWRSKFEKEAFRAECRAQGKTPGF